MNEASPQSVGARGPRSKSLEEAIDSRNYYARHARHSRLGYQISEVAVLTVSAAVPVVAVLNPRNSTWPAIVGAVVVVLTGLRSSFHWHEDWLRFSDACLAVTSELRLYEAGAPPYDDSKVRDTELIRRVNLVETTETSEWRKMRQPKPSGDQPQQ